MATKSFLFHLKKHSFLFLLLFLTACSSIRTRDSIRSERNETPSQQTNIPEALRPPPESNSMPAPAEPVRENPAPAPSRNGEAPKIGIILGPGSARAMAHIGVMQELNKAKLPITSVVGMEMGALVGSIYAQKAQPFDVEWQMSKMKDLKSLGPFIQGVFGNNNVEDLKLPFACPAYNMLKSQSYMMNRGQVTQMLPYCLSSLPLIKPYNQNVAALTELKTAVEYLRSKGATFIVYVHVLTSKKGVITRSLEDENNYLWSMVALSLSKQWQSVDYVLTVPVQDFDLQDWSKRRELIQKGLEAGQAGASQISKRLGL